ncbi:MAG TPA: SNF2-related protein [Xanthobacteraceae bacterium]|jgi:superfamily II DNA or RNA helicase|nr:SNF2-related protein [Xanthobacteraceae bacterium]
MGPGWGMVASSSEFQTKILRKNLVEDEYKLYRAALEWDLVDPIVIETRKDLKSQKRWQEHLEPYHHQVTNLITFCRRLPVTLLADDVGLGKTISAGLVASELIARARVSKLLIVCPKLLGPQWRDELKTKFDIPAEIATGRKLIDAEPEDVGAVITTYASARLHLDKLPEDRFQMLVLDEAHKLRNLYGVDPPPQVAVRFKKALEERRFRYVLMLTATPIQNRLWDLYSLVDLLTVARGHENPFGSEGMFARKFIADNRDQARQLKPEAHEEFRSIVYGYMSRVRRGDAKLYFPDRVVQLHRVDPTPEELELIGVIAKPIRKLNRLAQIGILQALTSSPHALMAQLTNMARNGTVPQDLAAAVCSIIGRMKTSAKLKGLGALTDELTRKNPERWRMVVFTGRIETQTTIQAFLEGKGLKVGIINGSSGQRNQNTIARFWNNPPDCHVIVSTEAGSEGVNLQVANVLVNYDLPWNPMIVEQRIGRIQRLASEHASVSILNIILKGTFEEYIVGRLMEKLQMAAHAIGDIEALLEASGIDDEEGGDSFDDKILRLVLKALAGKDVERATRQAEQSITEAKAKLEAEEANINSMLGSMDGAEYVGPRAPKLPPVVRSMDAREFALAALKSFGAEVTPQKGGLYLVEENGGREWIRFDESAGGERRATLYAPGSAAFSRLVSRMIATGLHRVEDADGDTVQQADEIARAWVGSFGGTPVGAKVVGVRRCFEGKALVRVRATVAHDSYERLVEVTCAPGEHRAHAVRSGLYKLTDVIENAQHLGIDTERLADAATRDPGIAEFCRFYIERRAHEVKAAGSDARKRKKLEDDFTPRLEFTVVALEGKMHREVTTEAQYQFGNTPPYASRLTVVPHTGKYIGAPELGRCESTGQTVPRECLGRCDMTGVEVLRHLLVPSELSARRALPEHTLRCSLSGKRVLLDEAELSAVTGNPVARSLLKTCALTGKRAEPEYFGRCEFTGAEALNTELAVSDVSGKRYRRDQQLRSAVSGKAGHKDEFLFCYETRQPMMPQEAEQCEVTGKFVRKGVLETCALTRKAVLPSELERCVVSDERVLKTLLVTSNVSGARLQHRLAVRSIAGQYCAPAEAKVCIWSGRRTHPDDVRVCSLTGIAFHVAFAAPEDKPYLQPLGDLLHGVCRTVDAPDRWEDVASKASAALRSRCRVEAAHVSPDNRHLAICSEVRTLLGLRVQQAGLLYSIEDGSIVGRIAIGKRTAKGWVGADN